MLPLLTSMFLHGGWAHLIGNMCWAVSRVLFPRARVYTLVPLIFLLFPIVQVPAALYLGFWFLM